MVAIIRETYLKATTLSGEASLRSRISLINYRMIKTHSINPCLTLPSKSQKITMSTHWLRWRRRPKDRHLPTLQHNNRESVALAPSSLQIIPSTEPDTQIVSQCAWYSKMRNSMSWPRRTSKVTSWWLSSHWPRVILSTQWSLRWSFLKGSADLTLKSLGMANHSGFLFISTVETILRKFSKRFLQSRNWGNIQLLALVRIWMPAGQCPPRPLPWYPALRQPHKRTQTARLYLIPYRTGLPKPT